MKMRKCDRCGNITPERIETVTSLDQAVNRLGDLILDAINTLTGKNEKYKLAKINGEEIDLCPDCQKSLKKWMKYGQAIKHNGKTYKLEKNEEKPAVEEINIRTNAAGIAEENIPKFGD